MDIDKKLRLIKLSLLGFLVFIVLFSLIKTFIWNRKAQIIIPDVVIETPKLRKVVDYITQTGTLVPYQSVDLVARVEGFLEKRLFDDGSFVKEGKVLFIIEQEPYLENLKAAKAKVAGSTASYEYSKIEYQRQKRMYKQNATSLNNVQVWYSKVLKYKANVDKNVADAANAAIKYSYTSVKAPFDGRIGRHLIDDGNVVGSPTPTTLATINKINPIYVYFNLSELEVIKIRDAARRSQFNAKNLDKIKVQVKMQNERKFIHDGSLDFVNTGLNASTGTLEFRAVLTNDNYMLLPGFFVQVRIPLTEPTLKIVIPQYAVLYDQSGPYVYTVNNKSEVLKKNIVLGGRSLGRIVVLSGLTKDDNLIVEGINNVIAGKKVVAIKGENKKQ
jgi:RND family efflux transporter MFP subunit